MSVTLVDVMLDNLCASNQLEETLKDQVRDVLLQRHRHLNEKHEKRHDNSSSKIHLPLIRSLADIGRKYSLPKDMHNHHGKSCFVELHFEWILMINAACL